MEMPELGFVPGPYWTMATHLTKCRDEKEVKSNRHLLSKCLALCQRINRHLKANDIDELGKQKIC